MATAFHDISAALDSHLNSMSGLPAVQWENRKYKPISGTLYIAPKNMQGKTIGVTGASDRTTGTYRIDIYSASGIGRNEAIVVADLIAYHFKQDSEITYNGVMVRIESVSRSQFVENANGWSRLTININYYSDTTRR
jgi:hypothetical protein